MTNKWLKMAQIYWMFARDGDFDFSPNAMQEMYDYESTGKGHIELGIYGFTTNGYYIGKHWMDVMIKMWRQDLGKTLFKEELYSSYPKWFVDGMV